MHPQSQTAVGVARQEVRPIVRRAALRGRDAPRIGGLRLEPGNPRIIAPFFRKLPPTGVREFARCGMDIAEICLDLAGAETPAAAAELARCFRCPTIVTARAAFEGGKWKGGESARLEALRAALRFADAVDIELAADEILPDIVSAAHSGGKTVIISRHNFAGTDSISQMDDFLQSARSLGADVFKIACAVADCSDAERMLQFVGARRERDDFPVIATAMGENEVARQTRMDLARSGSVAAFASADSKSAPGQWTLSETVAALRD